MGELNPTCRIVRRWSGEHLLICKGESRQGRGLAGPRGRGSALSLSCTPCPTRSRATGCHSPKWAWPGEGGLPAQVSARFTDIITHEGMWAPSLQITGCPTLLPAFPLPQPSALPRPSSCPRLVSLCTLLPLWEPPTKSEIHPPIQTAPLWAGDWGGQLHIELKKFLCPVDCPWSPTFSSLWVWAADGRSTPEPVRVGHGWF